MWGRREFLGLLTGVLSWAGLRPALAQAPIYPNPAAFDPKSLPYPYLAVRGDRALTEWERIRAEGKVWPVIIGDSLAASYLGDQLGYDPRTPAQIVSDSQSIVFPDALLELRKKEGEETMEDLRKRPPDEVAYRILDGTETDLLDENAGRPVTVGELLKAYESEPEGPEMGSWPATAHPSEGLVSTLDFRTGGPFDTVYILLVPTADPSAVPAFLKFGGWNACPAPEHQVAALRSLNDRFGAELVVCTNDTIELKVKRRPQSRDEAIALALGLYAYCNDSIDQGHETVSAFAAYLMANDLWHFWWD
jgi:hypothetical protein